MEKRMNWRAYWIILGSSVITSFMVLPYIFALNPAIAAVFTPVILAAQIIQASIIFSVATLLGLILAKKVGLGAPIIEGKKPFSEFKSSGKAAVGIGILGGVLIIGMSFLFGSMSLTFLEAEMRVAAWKGILASFYGGIAEEVIFRLFLMTLLIWLSTKISKTKEGKPTEIGVWVSIIVSTVLFGLGHLGITGGLVAITPVVIIRAVVLNGVSVLYGWLYWKKGLETAMIAHFTTDIVIHVITPAIGRLVNGS